MTSVSTVASPAATSSTASTGSASTPTSAYTSDLFLKLLTTQLQNQDPSSPMDSTQMISQTASLAEMEQLTSLNTQSSDSYDLQQRTAAANVLGKSVSWKDASTGDTDTGIVSAVSFSGSTPTVTVGSQTLNLSDLTGISEPSAASS